MDLSETKCKWNLVTNSILLFIDYTAPLGFKNDFTNLQNFQN